MTYRPGPGLTEREASGAYVASADGVTFTWNGNPVTGFGGGAGSLTPTAVKTANYTAAAGDLVPVDTTSGAITVTLPTAPADKTQIGLKHIVQGGTNAVTVACGGAAVFNKAGGATSFTMPLLAQAATMQYKASTGVWYVMNDDLPLTQLDGRFMGQAAGAATVKTNGTPDPAGGVGLVIDKTVGNPGVYSGTIAWSVAGARKWDIGMDVLDVQFALLYDFVGSGVAGATSGDLIRVAPGGYFQMARNAGSASPHHRLHIIGDDHDDATMSDLVYLELGTGAPAADFMRGQFASVERFNINRSGFAAFGRVYTGNVTNGALEVQTAASIIATVGVTPALQIVSTGNTNNRTWAVQIATSDGGLNFRDITGSKTPLQIQGGSADNTILIGSTFLRLGAAATSVGFYGSSGAVQSTGWTTLTGTATKAAGAFDTSTVTTAQLAQVVKALLDRHLATNLVSA